jgi:hypothetical protein
MPNVNESSKEPNVDAIDRQLADNDGGYAFPQALRLQHEYVGSNGMSLRDYFAGQAVVTAMHGNLWSTGSDQELAALVYRIADAMLTERAK